MKKLLTQLGTFTFLISTLFLCTACPPDKEDDPILTVSGNPNVELSSDGTAVTASVTVTAENTDWGVMSNDSWIRASKNGQTVMVSADKNTNTDDRKGTIIISATKDSKQTSTLYVTQKGVSPYILVNGSESNSLTFEGGFDGKSGIDYKQTITITSNVNWNASSIPSWLSVSPVNGNGTVQMTLYPKDENTSSSSRSATISLTGNGISASINVIQTSDLSRAKVTPSNLVALYNQIGWDLVETGTVNKFHWLCISESEMKRMTDNELLEALLKEESKKYVDDYMFFPAYDSNGYSIKENTKYYICTVAFDMNEKRGEVVKSEVTTPAYLDADKDAWVSFPSDDLRYGSSGFQFTAVKEGFCDTYHVIYGNLPSDYTYPAVAFAFEINYYLKNKKKHWFANNWYLDIVTNYPNTHTFTYTTYLLDYYPLVTIFARGVFKDGKESSDMRGGQWDVSSNNSPIKISASNSRNENVIIKRSEEKARARKFFRK